MSEAKSADELPDQFIVITHKVSGELSVRRYTQRGVNNWDVHALFRSEWVLFGWVFLDNVTDVTAIDAVNTGNVYARVRQ